MKKFAIGIAAAVGLVAAYALAHWALIEVGREVVVLRTQDDDGSWYRSRLWIVDLEGIAWLHGAESRWMRNLRERPEVEVVRGGDLARYRAEVVRGPHMQIDARLRAKYGAADRWVRFLLPDDETTAVVRLDPLPGAETGP